MDFKIFKTDLNIERENILNFLRPNEKFALFLIANLKNNDFPSKYYVAKSNNKIVGVSAYFPVFKSFSLFTEHSDVACEFVDSAAKECEITTLLSIADCGRFALDEFLKLGYVPKKDPKYAFLELDIKNFHFFDSKEGKVRKVEEKDVDQIVILHRYLHDLPINKPISEDERKRVILSPIKYCLEIDGKIVSSALSNGIVEEAFQILGVVTHPDYRKKGFAKAVCSHLIKNLIDNDNAKKAILFTNYDNVPSLKCYHSLGFKITNEYYYVDFES